MYIIIYLLIFWNLQSVYAILTKVIKKLLQNTSFIISNEQSLNKVITTFVEKIPLLTIAIRSYLQTWNGAPLRKFKTFTLEVLELPMLFIDSCGLTGSSFNLVCGYASPSHFQKLWKPWPCLVQGIEWKNGNIGKVLLYTIDYFVNHLISGFDK